MKCFVRMTDRKLQILFLPDFNQSSYCNDRIGGVTLERIHIQQQSYIFARPTRKGYLESR